MSIFSRQCEANAGLKRDGKEQSKTNQTGACPRFLRDVTPHGQEFSGARCQVHVCHRKSSDVIELEVYRADDQKIKKEVVVPRNASRCPSAPARSVTS